MYIDYSLATTEQRVDFRRVNSQLAPDFGNYRLWITKSGRASLKKGHWEWTKKYANSIDKSLEVMRHGESVRT